MPETAGAGAFASAPDAAGSVGCRAARRIGWRAVVLILLACVSLLGEGERLHIDARFKTPSSTLYTYWRALRYNDIATVSECFIEPRASLPFPGMVWFLPPVDAIDLRSMKLVGAEAGHLIAVYEVEFRPVGSLDLESFITSTELQRVGHEWRIIPPSGDAAMPTWKPYRSTVDI